MSEPSCATQWSESVALLPGVKFMAVSPSGESLRLVVREPEKSLLHQVHSQGPVTGWSDMWPGTCTLPSLLPGSLPVAFSAPSSVTKGVSL